MLLRTEKLDGVASDQALLAVFNPDANIAAPFELNHIGTEDWDLPNAELLTGGNGDHLAPREARLFAVTRRKAIRRKDRAPPDDAAYAAKKPRIIISNISPSIDGSDHAIKRVAGDCVTVEADILTDGHTLIAAELLFRPEDECAWRRVDMQPLGNDRWQANFTLQRVGRYRFAIEAWLDIYGSFARDLAKKRSAGQDVSVDLMDGRRALETAAQRALGALKAPLAVIVSAFDRLQNDEKAAALLAPETILAVRSASDRAFLALSATFLVDADRRAARFSSWYELFPRSQTDDHSRHGTFADVVARLPAIQAMGFDVLYLPPIHPIGTTNRKGRSNATTAAEDDPGSVYAIGSKDGGHDAIHPHLGNLDDFRALVATAHSCGIEIALDFAVQCSPDHPWLSEHPGWFDWRADGSIQYAENPPKKYEDIVNVDFYGKNSVPALWLALRDIVLFWIESGVRIFRVDNPHTKPLPFWQWLIADIRGNHPDTIFLAEAFTRPKLMYALARLGFTQSYTYFTWRNTKQELTDYLLELSMPPVSDFFRPHFFVNTPDINPYFLQTSGRPGFLIRAVLGATLSGLWGIYSGFELCEAAALPDREEYSDSEKYAVKPRNWEAPGNIIADIGRLNRLRKAEPALPTHTGITFYNAFNDNIIYYGKYAPGESTRLMVIVNLNPHGVEEADFEIPLWEWGLSDSDALAVEDAFNGARFTWHGKIQRIRLAPDAPFRVWRVSPAMEV
jgi:starch synthase (maltosyl-transferring)